MQQLEFIESANAVMVMLVSEVLVDIAAGASFHADAIADMHTVASLSVILLAQMCCLI